MNSTGFRIAIKNIFNGKLNSIVSIAGLTIAFVAIFYIYSYVSFEMGYDAHHKKSDRIYRISGDIVASENTMTHAVLGPLLAESMKEEYPEIEESARLGAFRQATFLNNQDKKYKITEAYRADQAIFKVFTLDLIYGDEQNALNAPNQVVINESLAKKIFGDKNPVGLTLMQNNQLITVTGVIKDSPKNAHHKLNVLFSPPSFDTSKLSPVRYSEAYWMPSAYTFILLKPKCKITDITNNFEPFYKKYMALFGEHLNATFKPIAIPLNDLHFSRHMSYDYPKGNKSYTWILICVAAFIFLIALLNYGNLLLFKSTSNSKNIGVQKIIGASNVDIYKQLSLNSVTFAGIAVILALIIFKITLKHVSAISSLIPNEQINWTGILVVALMMVICMTVIASLIPFVNQYKKQGLALINNTQKVYQRLGLRTEKSIAIAQFTLSVILIMFSLGITKQINFFLDSDMGFDKNNVILINLPDEEITSKSALALKEDLLNTPLIAQTSISTRVPGEVMGSIQFMVNKNGNKATKIVNLMAIDYDYLPLMSMQLATGRNFDAKLSTDAQSIIVNEALMEYCGFDDSDIGKPIEGAVIIGVLKDVNFNSLHNPAQPMLFRLIDHPHGYLNIKIASSDITAAIEKVQQTWKTYFPEHPFEYEFLDQRVAMLYQDDQKKNLIMQLFALISIIISAMGFLNLTSIICEQKTKEIGIRKVNGAKISEILAMLNKDFVKWVAIAFMLACPIAWYAMDKWLENFAYQTALSWWIFALAGVVALGIAILTVSWQSWKAATRNPVEALRYE
ncbi:ABC transporter permease [Puteibacter caeruleilacunae]|nr:ABC transporter permease [Puteibacter caeruleilacunae]